MVMKEEEVREMGDEEYFSNEFVREKADADAEATPKVEVESIKKSHERVSKVHRWRDESHDN